MAYRASSSGAASYSDDDESSPIGGSGGQPTNDDAPPNGRSGSAGGAARRPSTTVTPSPTGGGGGGRRSADQHDKPLYLLEHLATFTVDKAAGIQLPADGIRRLLQLEKTTGIWSQKMQLQLDRDWVLIVDFESGVRVAQRTMAATGVLRFCYFCWCGRRTLSSDLRRR